MTTKRKQPKAVKQWAVAGRDGRYLKCMDGGVLLYPTIRSVSLLWPGERAIRVLITPVIGRK